MCSENEPPIRTPANSVVPTLPSSQALSSQRIFEAWLASHNAGASVARREVISTLSARQYRMRWESWCRWLEEIPAGKREPRAVHALAATPDLAREFLQVGRSSRSTANQSRADPTRASTPFGKVTQRRYWDTLQRIYQWAANQGHITANPVRSDKPPPPEKRSSAIVADPVWRAIPKCLPTRGAWTDLRDRALILVAMDAALTPAELCGLQLRSVSSTLGAPERITLELQGVRDAQDRTLYLQQTASDALNAWLLVRARFAAEGTIARQAEQHVFLSQRNPRDAYSPEKFYVLARKVLTAAAHAAHMPVDHAQLSPMIFRNTRLVMRLRATKKYDQILYDAGLKHEAALAGLLQRVGRPGH